MKGIEEDMAARALGSADAELPQSQPESDASAAEAASPEWLRADNLLYTLTQEGWRRGEPVMVNRMTVTVHWDPRFATDAEGDALAERLLAHLNAAGEPQLCGWCGERVSGPCSFPNDPCGLYGDPTQAATPTNQNTGHEGEKL